jgi:hypothetical protein
MTNEKAREFGDRFVNNLDAIFKEHGAKLHITKPDYAYIQLGRYSFYFHKSKDNPIITKEVETMRGEKVTQTIISYDGWEMYVGDLDKEQKGLL